MRTARLALLNVVTIFSTATLGLSACVSTHEKPWIEMDPESGSRGSEPS